MWILNDNSAHNGPFKSSHNVAYVQVSLVVSVSCVSVD